MRYRYEFTLKQVGFVRFKPFYLPLVFPLLLIKIFQTGEELFQQREGFIPFLSGVYGVDAIQCGQQCRTRVNI